MILSDRSSAQLPGGGRCSLFLDRLAQGARESRQRIATLRARGHGIGVGRCMLQRARATTGELERRFRRDRAGPAHAPRASGSQDDTSLSPKSGRARPDSDCCACAAERRVVCTGRRRAPRFGGLPPSPCRRRSSLSSLSSPSRPRCDASLRLLQDWTGRPTGLQLSGFVWI